MDKLSLKQTIFLINSYLHLWAGALTTYTTPYPPKRDCMRNGTLLDQTYFLNFTSGFGFGIILGQNCYDKVQNDGLTRQGKQAKNTRTRSRLQLLILQSGSGLERLLHFQVQSCLSFMWPLRPGTFKLKPEMVCRFYASGNALPLKLK